MFCKHCFRPYGQHTLGCLTAHLGDRDPACGCEACHRSDSTRSIDLGCWVEGEDLPPVLRPSLATSPGRS